MEARLTRQLLHIIELDRSGDLTPAIQEQISDVLDHLHAQLAPGGAVRSPTGPGLLGGVSKAGLAPYMGTSAVKVPKVSFPKLPAAPKLPGLKT